MNTHSPTWTMWCSPVSKSFHICYVQFNFQTCMCVDIYVAILFYILFKTDNYNNNITIPFVPSQISSKPRLSCG